MKLLSTIVLLILCVSSIYTTAACTPGKCSNCRGDSSSTLYCTRCYKSVLKGTAADLKDGFCEGDSTGITNCLETTRDGATTKCARCEPTFMLTNSDAECTAITVTNCNLWREISSGNGDCNGCTNGNRPNLLGSTCDSGTSYDGCFSVGRGSGTGFCAVCEDGKMLSEDKTSCVTGTGNHETCNRFLLTQPDEWCQECNTIMGYLPYAVSPNFKTGD